MADRDAPTRSEIRSSKQCADGSVHDPHRWVDPDEGVALGRTQHVYSCPGVGIGEKGAHGPHDNDPLDQHWAGAEAALTGKPPAPQVAPTLTPADVKALIATHTPSAAVGWLTIWANNEQPGARGAMLAALGMLQRVSHGMP